MRTILETISACRAALGAAVAPQVAASLLAFGRGDTAFAVAVAALLSPEQLSGGAALPDPLPLPERAVIPLVDELAAVHRRLALFAALSVTHDPGDIVDAGGFDVELLLRAEAGGAISISRGAVRFADDRLRAHVLRGAGRAELGSAHQALARCARERGAVSASTWHAMHATAPVDDTACVRMLGLAERSLATGDARTGLRRARLVVARAQGRTRARGCAIAGLAAFWSGHFEEARDLLAGTAGAPAALRRMGERTLEAIDRHVERPTGELYERERAVGMFRLLSSIAASPADRHALGRLARVCDALYAGPDDADALHAKLVLTVAGSSRPDAAAPRLSPLAESHLLLMRIAFQVENGDLDGAAAALAEAAPRLPLVRPTVGIVAGFVRIVATGSSRVDAALADAYEALSEEALDYRLLGTPPQRLTADAIAAVADQNPPGDAARRRVRPHVLAELSPRQRHAVRLLASGMSNREIAETLQISARTVEVHLGQAYRKLGVASRAGLLARLISEGV